MSWRALILNNAGWKVVSLVLAVLIWGVLNAGLQSKLKPMGTRLFPHQPITVMTTAQDDRVFRVEPATVEVSVSGPPDVLLQLHPGDIEAYVNLTTVMEAKRLRKRIQVYLPAGVSVSRVSPGEVFVQVVPFEVTNGPPQTPR